MTTKAHTCTRTGLRLAPARAELTWRVAKTARGGLSVPSREAADPVTGWNRYDTIGSTLYLASTQSTALMEVLSPFKRTLGAADVLAKDAAALGLSLQVLVDAIAEEWGERYFMGTGCLPAIWRDERSLYRIRLPEHGWWVDIEHPDSIAALAHHLEAALTACGITQLTTAHLRGDSRRITVAVAEWVRAQVLDDGAMSLGIRFGSKHGSGSSWAYWMRRVDLGVDGEPLEEVNAATIGPTLAALTQVCGRLGIRAH